MSDLSKREIVRNDRVVAVVQAPPHTPHQRRIHDANRNVLDAFRRYFMAGRKPGGFVTKCIHDSLTGATAHADEDMQACLGAVAMYLTNDLDGRCWGSVNAYNRWRNDNGAVGTMGLDEAIRFAEGRI